MLAVAFTGLGLLSPNGNNKKEYWQALKEGISGLGPVTRFNASGYTSQIAGEVNWHPSQFDIPALNADQDHRSPTSKLIIAAAFAALKEAGLSQDEFSNSSSGIWIGTSTTDIGIVEVEYAHFKNNGTTTPHAITSSYPHSAASTMGTELRCLGPVITLSIGCTSGLFSIISAAEAILKGEVEIALAGGGDAPISPFFYSGLCSLGLLSTSFNSFPEAASRPFDARRDGGVLSEGAGMVVLERAERAAARGKPVYGYLSGWGRSNSYSPAVMQEAFCLSISGALKAAGLGLTEVDYICANALGDRYIDAMELKAIKKVFSRHAYNIPISSIKSMIGSPLAAAGPLQIIASLLAMQEKIIPPTINLEDPKPRSGLDLVANKHRVARIKNVLVNAQGLGGSNVSLILSSSNGTIANGRAWG